MSTKSDDTSKRQVRANIDGCVPSKRKVPKFVVLYEWMAPNAPSIERKLARKRMKL